VNSLWIDDRPVTTPGSDPFFGASVVFNARIVDVDPADTFSTQFVAAAFSVVGRNARGQVAELISGVPTTSFTRFLNFYRYRGAGTFQSVIPNDRLTFVSDDEAPDSPALRALRDAARQGGGLLLRYCFYGMKAAANQMQMYDRFQQGEAAVNPKVGSVLGSLTAWNGSDVVTAPVGRLLQQPGPPYFPATEDTPPIAMHVKTHEDVERIATPRTLLHDQSAATKCEQSMGPAVALIDDGRVVLDLLTSFPEIGCAKGADGDPFDKHDFGPVELELVYDAGSGPTTATLGRVGYDRATYEKLAGVYELAFDPASEAGRNIETGSLQLRDPRGTVLLREIETVQVVSDDPAVYMDLAPADGGLRATGTARLRVFCKGRPIEEPVTLQVQRYSDIQRPGKLNSVNPLVVIATEIDEEPAETTPVEVAPPGELALELSADKAGCYKLRFIAPGMVADYPGSPNFAVEYYTSYRVLPHDDYSEVPDEEITFEFIYREVLNYYAILYPVMSTIIPWGPENTPQDPQRVAQFAALISQAIDEDRLGTALEMPITRELSAGKRALLKRWCARELST
jgi:hypothetical protein